MSWWTELRAWGSDLGPFANLTAVIGFFGTAFGVTWRLFKRRSDIEKAWKKAVDDLGIWLTFRGWTYVRSRVLPEDLPELYEEAQRLFGNDVSPLDMMTKWLKRNQDIAWRIDGRKGDDPKKMVGFFELLPLTKDAIRKLDQNRLDGRSMELGHVSTRGNRSSAYYIGSVAVVSKSQQFEFATLFKLLEHLRDLARVSELTLYARPANEEDGVRLVKRYGFTPINKRFKETETVWKLVIPRNYDPFEKFKRISKKIGGGAPPASDSNNH